MFLGIDIGSSSSKAVLLNDECEIIARRSVNMGTGTKGSELAVSAVLEAAGISEEDVLYSIVTGYGRMNYEKANEQITEIACHAKGVYREIPSAGSIIDIGGQDAKVILLGENGRVVNFVMNEKCAAGTGRFFEVMGRVLNCSLDELSEIAATDEAPVTISSVCTVFAESEVISQLAGGASRSAVAKGAHNSVAKRVAGLSGRIGLKADIVMSGGVAINKSMVKAMSDVVKSRVITPEFPQTMGAFGAAIFAFERFHGSKELSPNKGERK
jgi:predicted CoA-substrate-specific enzyme activase